MKNILLFLFLLSISFVSAQITLTHNVGNTPIDTGMPNCEYDEYWARTFTLSEFGISTADQFIIRSGQVAISKSYEGARLGIGVFSIDSSFPNSKPKPLGNGGSVVTPYIDGVPQIIQIEFNRPIVVPAGVERILVVATQSDDVYNPDYTDIIIAGTKEDNNVSWFKGCREYYTYTPTTNLANPVSDANFFINVTGDINKTKSLGSTTRLSHNFCDDLVKTINNSCSYSYIYAGRDFYLEDFGISDEEEFIITEGQLAYSYAEWGAAVQFNIYNIDDNFPDSFSELELIGSSQMYDLAYFNTFGAIKTENMKFDNPIIVPAGTKRVLVEIFKGILGGGSGLLHIAGTQTDDGAPTWYRGCLAGSNYINSDEMTTYSSWPGKDYNFYINVTGNVNHVTNNFEMNISNICSEFLKEFSVENKANVASVNWDFGDPASGLDNMSTDFSPYHDFSADGTYIISATVVGKDGSMEVLTETIDVKEPPNAYGIDNIYACEAVSNSGVSTSFDTSFVEQQVLGGQLDKVITYIDGAGNEYSTLPNPFTNTVKDRETISVRVAHSGNPCCYSETTFDLIVNPLPNIESVKDLIVCESETNGFAIFNLEELESEIIDNKMNIDVAFYFENGQQIAVPLNAIENLVINEEEITVRIINTDTNCYNETTFNLIVSPIPIANALDVIIGCDDNNDGVSEYFDTSNVQDIVLGSQSNMEVSYFDSSGNILSSPLSNPYTNNKPNQEIITVRVTNPVTDCYAETILEFQATTQPVLNKPQDLYACNTGNGFGVFDTSTIENQILSNQKGWKILYFDENENPLESPLPSSFQNQEPWSQTIRVKVENEFNALCYSETSFNLVVNELPGINLDSEYFLCDLEPWLYLSLNNIYDSWEWSFQDGTIISNTFEAQLVNEGNYSVKVTNTENGLSCENTVSLKLIRSALPSIKEVKYGDLSDENFIEIIAEGDGEFQYSIDGENYQDSNLFSNIQGGIYLVSVKDKKGCGKDDEEVTILDYPKYFTPNNDSYNDTWQIVGITKYPEAKILIYNRYGKLLKQIAASSPGWDGTYRGEIMPEADYWFTADLNTGKPIVGHFSLKR